MRLADNLRNLIASEHPRSGQTDQAAGGAGAARAQAALARVLAEEVRRGRMRIDDPEQAAELFFDLVIAGRTSGLVQADLDTRPAADIDTAADACGRIFARAYATDPDDLEGEIAANPALLAAGRVPIGYPIHPRKEASR